jgi:osmotically-inducible protein OsmY
MRLEVMAMLAVLSVGACASEKKAATTATTGATEQGQAMGADQIRQALLKQYPDAAPAINAMQIDTSGGKVTLRGSVNDEQTKKSLVDGVKKIPGVSNVSDELHVPGK